MSKLEQVGVFGMLIFLMLMGGYIGVQVISAEKFTIEVRDMLLTKLNVLEGQMPKNAEYYLLAKQIKEQTGDRLTGFEIREVASEIMLQCELNRDINLTPSRVLAVIERESGFRPDIISHMGAYGLMQCLEATFAVHLPRIGYPLPTKELMLDPIINVRVGIRELVRLKRMWIANGYEGRDDWKITFYSYYAGETWARRLLTTLEKGTFPGLEYGVGTEKLARAWGEKGIS